MCHLRSNNIFVLKWQFNGFADTSLIQPLVGKFVISEETKSVFLSDDLLLLIEIYFASILNGS